MGGTREVRDPRLTILLTVQPSVIEKMQDQPEFASRGLTPRFLYSAPESLVGFRNWDMTDGIDTIGQGVYRRLILGLSGADDGAALSLVADLSDLTDGQGEEQEKARGHRRFRELNLSQAAFDRYKECRREIEPALVDEDDALSGFPAWGNKLPGQMLKIAAVLQLAKRAELGDQKAWETPVQADTIESGGRRNLEDVEDRRHHVERPSEGVVPRPLTGQRRVAEH